MTQVANTVSDTSACPRVSVWMLTYNHEKFIAQAIESVLMQQANFDYELVIGEDCSTDGTRAIVAGYQARYPDRIRALLSEKNIGMQNNARQTFAACRGKYIAFLEGDDYWTSSDKLQRQSDYLDIHPECSMCFHNVVSENTDKSSETDLRFTEPMLDYYTLDDIAVVDFIPTASVMVRAGMVLNLPAWYWKMPVLDWPLWVISSQHGKLGYIDEVMGVYRIHSGGDWSRRSDLQRAETNLVVAPTIRRELRLRVPRLDQRIHKIRREAIQLTMEMADFKRASFHAKRYLASSFSFLFYEFFFLLNLVIHGDAPRLWRLLQRIKAIILGRRSHGNKPRITS